MPYTGPTFSSRHNKKLKGKAASTAARMANAMEKAGVPVGEAIATANKHGDKMMGIGRKRRTILD